MPVDTAIKVEHLTKIYKLYNSPIDRLKEALSPIRSKYHHDFHALHDVSFEVEKGDSVGIIGKNGSGKSTLLKIITKVLTPTSGIVTVNGRISALLELGAGFNPEMTGLENVYFTGTLMGYKKEEMSERLENIISFADIGEFVRQPVKTYSSGMFVRLAFAVAVNVEPDILVVDEALAVGDLRFQKKCKLKMNEFKERKITLVIVSHNMSDISSSCRHALYLKNGIPQYYGDSVEAISRYLEQEHFESAESSVQIKADSGGTGDMTVHSIACYQSGRGKGCSQILFGQNIVIEIAYEAFNPVYKPLLRVNFSAVGYRFFVNFDFKLSEYSLIELQGKGVIRMEVLKPNIYPGSYTVNVAFLTEEVNCHFFRWNDAASFTILAEKNKNMQRADSLIELNARIIELE